jgi:hypothetical protein
MIYYICIICDIKTKYKSKFDIHVKTNKHIKNILNLNDNIYMCNKCKKTYNSDKYYYKHIECCYNNDLCNDINCTNNTCNNKNSIQSVNNINNNTINSINTNDISYNKNECIKECINNDSTNLNPDIEYNNKLIKLTYENKIMKIEEDKNKKILKLKEKILELKEKNIKLENDLSKIDLKVDHEKEKCDIYKKTSELLESSMEITKSALKYANLHYKNAPGLEPITNFNILNYDISDEKQKKELLNIILYNYRQKTITQLFGDHIISIYKKDIPNEQSIYSTDSSRLNYIIKSNQKNKWKVDKRGITVCKSLMDELLLKYCSYMSKYRDELLLEMSSDPKNISSFNGEKIKNIINFNNDIENKILHKNINKYIAPNFNMSRN